MNRRSRAALSTLSWTLLLAAILIGLVSSDSSELYESVDDDVASLKSDGDARPARKYLELDDLNAFESPAAEAANYASGEKLIPESHKNHGKSLRPKRSPQSGNVRQQQQQRVTRQNAKKQRPGFFWTLARVTFETFNDTKSAIQQIGQILNESIPPEPPRKKPSTSLKKPISKPPTNGIKTASLTGSNATTTPEPPSTTTEFKLTRPVLQSLIRRNVKGLVRLFNIEWRDALNQSEKNIQEFQRDLGKQLSMYLQDNPDNY